MFSFLTHFSNRRRVNDVTKEKTVRTDERIAQRIVEDYPEMDKYLVSEVSIAFDGMLVDFAKIFPALCCQMEMLFSYRVSHKQTLSG